MKLTTGTRNRLTILNTVMVGINTLMLIWLVADRNGGGAPEASPATVGTAATRTTPAAGGASARDEDPAQATRSADPVENFLLSTIVPLRSAARDLERDVSLPSDAEVAACVKSGSLSATPCTTVLARLEEGYKAVGMPFPKPPDIRGGDGPSSSEGGGDAPGGSASTGSQVLQVYFDTLQARLGAAAKAAGEQPDLPEPAAIAAAVATGDPRSAESQAVIDHLRTQFGRYDLRFTEPYVGGAGAPTSTPSAPAPSASSGAQQELLASYLDHMIQRLERAAGDQGKDLAGLKPSAAAVAAAVGSGRVDSDETQAVLATLRSAYSTLDLEFTEPPL